VPPASSHRQHRIRLPGGPALHRPDSLQQRGLSSAACRQVGCGADELIDLLMRCVLDPGDSIVDTPPTFTMYAFDAAVNDAKVVTVPRRADFSVDVPGAGAAHGFQAVHRHPPACPAL